MVVEYTTDTFKCGVCSANFDSIVEYAKHMVLQEKCSMVLVQCSAMQNLLLPRFLLKSGSSTDKAYADENDFPTPQAVFCGKSTRWKCPVCNLTFSRQAAYMNHYSLQHKGDSIDLQSKQGKRSANYNINLARKIKKMKEESMETIDTLNIINIQRESPSLDSSSLTRQMFTIENPAVSTENAVNDKNCGIRVTYELPVEPNDYNGKYSPNQKLFTKQINKLVDNVHDNLATRLPTDTDIISIKSNEVLPLNKSNLYMAPINYDEDIETQQNPEHSARDEDIDESICGSSSISQQDIEDLNNGCKSPELVDLEHDQVYDVPDNEEDDILSVYGTEGLSCNLCGQTFKNKRTLQQHINVVHVITKPFVCSVSSCGQAFKTKGSLTRHLRRHSDERPYVCAVCGRSFRESGTLQRHRQCKVSCALKTDAQLNRYRAIVQLPNGATLDSKASVPRLLKQEVADAPSASSSRIIKQERDVKMSHRRPVPVPSPGPVYTAATAHQTLLTIKQESGAVGRNSPHAAAGLSLRCKTEQMLLASEDEMDSPPESPSSVMSLNPSLVDVPVTFPAVYGQEDFASINENGPEELIDEQQSIEYPRDVKPRISLTQAGGDIKPRFTLDIKPRVGVDNFLGDRSPLSDVGHDAEAASVASGAQDAENDALFYSRMEGEDQMFSGDEEHEAGMPEFSHLEHPSSCNATTSSLPNTLREGSRSPPPATEPSISHVQLPSSSEHKVTSDDQTEAENSNDYAPPTSPSAEDTNAELQYTCVYNCMHCIRSFKMRSALMNHLYSHTDKIGPQCSECSRSFSNKSGVVRHMVRHSSVRRFVCPLCPSEFTHLSQLQQHQLSHSQTRSCICDICGRAFKTVSARNLHARSHTGAREVCTMCGRAFTTRGSLQRHQRTHTGVKPYACTHCKQAFRDSCTLARHLKNKKPCCLLNNEAPPLDEEVQIDGEDADQHPNLDGNTNQLENNNIAAPEEQHEDETTRQNDIPNESQIYHENQPMHEAQSAHIITFPYTAAEGPSNPENSYYLQQFPSIDAIADFDQESTMYLTFNEEPSSYIGE